MLFPRAGVDNYSVSGPRRAEKGNIMHKLGLKLYSSNGFYIRNASALYAEGLYQYIELYVEPGTVVGHLSAWKKLDIPMALHAPHTLSGFNLSLKEKMEDNRRLLVEVEAFRKALNPRWVIFHSGTDGTPDETIRQMAIFRKEFPGVFGSAVVENKPRKGIKGERCIGASPEEVGRIISESGLGFCLDFGHAICHAATCGEDYMEVIDRFMRLNPVLFHISDGYASSETDNHLHFGDGDFRIGDILGKIPAGAWLSIEAPKEKNLNLEDFRKDAQSLKKLLA